MEGALFQWLYKKAVNFINHHNVNKLNYPQQFSCTRIKAIFVARFIKAKAANQKIINLSNLALRV